MVLGFPQSCSSEPSPPVATGSLSSSNPSMGCVEASVTPTGNMWPSLLGLFISPPKHANDALLTARRVRDFYEKLLTSLGNSGEAGVELLCSQSPHTLFGFVFYIFVQLSILSGQLGLAPGLPSLSHFSWGWSCQAAPLPFHLCFPSQFRVIKAVGNQERKKITKAGEIL